MLYQALSAFGSFAGGVFSGFLLSVLMVFVLAWMAGSLKDPVRLLVQGLVIVVLFLPAIVFLCVFVMSDWLMALGAVIPIVWFAVSLLRVGRSEASGKPNAL